MNGGLLGGAQTWTRRWRLTLGGTPTKEPLVSRLCNGGTFCSFVIKRPINVSELRSLPRFEAGPPPSTSLESALCRLPNPNRDDPTPSRPLRPQRLSTRFFVRGRQSAWEVQALCGRTDGRSAVAIRRLHNPRQFAAVGAIERCVPITSLRFGQSFFRRNFELFQS